MPQRSEYILLSKLEKQGYDVRDLLINIVRVVEKQSLVGDVFDLMASTAAHTMRSIVNLYQIGELGKEPEDMTKKEIEIFYENVKDMIDRSNNTLESVTKRESKELYFPVIQGYMKDGVKGSGMRKRVKQHSDKRMERHSESNGQEWYIYFVKVDGIWEEYDSSQHGDVNFDVVGHFAPKLSANF